MLNEVQMHSQARMTPQLNGNHCLNEGESMHIITAVCKFINESKRFGYQTFQLFIKLFFSNVLQF